MLPDLMDSNIHSFFYFYNNLLNNTIEISDKLNSMVSDELENYDTYKIEYELKHDVANKEYYKQVISFLTKEQRLDWESL